MKTRNIFISLLALISLSSISLNYYFYTRLIYLENETKGWYMNNNSYLCHSFLGGKRLFNENGKRSQTFPAIFFNDRFANDDSLVRFRDYNGKMGYINSSSMEVEIPASFHFLTEFSNELALSIQNSSDSCYGFINREAKIVIKPNQLLQTKFAFGDDIDRRPPRFINGFCIIPVKDGFTIINKKGNKVSDIYNSLLTFSIKNYIFAYEVNNSWGAVIYDKKKNYFIEYIKPKYKSKQELFNQCKVMQLKQL